VAYLSVEPIVHWTLYNVLVQYIYRPFQIKKILFSLF